MSTDLKSLSDAAISMLVLSFIFIAILLTLTSTVITTNSPLFKFHLFSVLFVILSFLLAISYIFRSIPNYQRGKKKTQDVVIWIFTGINFLSILILTPNIIDTYFSD